MIFINNIVNTFDDRMVRRSIIDGMRNPMNSWDKSDTSDDSDLIGSDDMDLMWKLSQGGPTHGKFKRMIVVYMDITAPLYWWKEFDTYKVGTVANSCSTMHKIHSKDLHISDFSHERLSEESENVLRQTINTINKLRKLYLQTNDKKYWDEMIQLLPSSYNQRRTVMLNYEVLTNIYHTRKDHKLEEWRSFCDIMADELYLSWLFTGEEYEELNELKIENFESKDENKLNELKIENFESDDENKLNDFLYAYYM